MSNQFLDGAWWRASHGQMRAERVPEDVHAHVAEIDATGCPSDQPLHLSLREALAVISA